MNIIVVNLKREILITDYSFFINMLEICAIGGYQNVGRNMTAIKYNDEVVILDMGLDLERYIAYTEDEDPFSISSRQLMKAGAIPNDSIIDKWKDQVLAIIPTHAHLDHVGAIPFMSNKYKNAKILCTPFTAAVLERISIDDKRPINNKINVLSENSNYHLSKNIEIEFINITHSTPHTVVVVIHTPEGSVVYANDFKFDYNPLLGKKPNEKRLSELQDVKLLIMDSLYSDREGHTPGETWARDQLLKIFDENASKDNILITTTFSSHISRLKTLVDIAKRLRRTPIFLGRSLSKYALAAQEAGLARFEDECEIVRYSGKVKRAINRMKKVGLSKYFIICSGHQGEPKATLTKIIKRRLLELDNNDVVVFSSTIIPNEENYRNREELEGDIKSMGAKIFTDIHVSGHASRDDHKKLIELIKPSLVIPAHANEEKTQVMIDYCKKLGVLSKSLKEGDFFTL